jgi:DNA-binding response OmpR family regulator
VTASALQEERGVMLNSGMDDFVLKPYRFNDIYDCLSKQLGVQYVYRETHEEKVINDIVLTKDVLAVLPAALREELHAALESLESQRINAVIQQVASHDAALHKTLQHFVDNFDYPAILKALENN